MSFQLESKDQDIEKGPERQAGRRRTEQANMEDEAKEYRWETGYEKVLPIQEYGGLGA